MSAAERRERTLAADRLVAQAAEKAGVPEAGVAIAAVGGYGRGELAPYSDLDVVLVHEDGIAVGEWAADVWYPLWDSGARLDHSVRSETEVVERAGADLRVMLGLLDLRHLAGDTALTLRLRTTVLTQWRRDARSRLPELHRLTTARGELLGPLAHAAVPDLKESTGGLRDATVLKALVASWLVDVPHGDVERSRTALLDLRDALHEVADRATDRVAPEYWPEVAERLGLADAEAAQRHARALGRRIAHVSRLTWRRAEATLARGPATAPRRPRLERLAPGVAASQGEVVLDRGVAPDSDPLLLLRAAAEAAERGLELAPATAARLARDGVSIPEPWPAEARDLLVRLLAAGPGLEAVWETLDETGAITRLLPEWDRVRLLPHATTVHRFTVDRHMVETCIRAATLIRRVGRPDLLVVAALLHDIGKGLPQDHSVAGEPIARAVAERLGFAPADVDVVGTLVRRHLLLPEIATTRDPDDPATVAAVTEAVGDPETLLLLRTLTEADALATSDKAWTTWRAALIDDLHQRAQAALGDRPAARPEPEPAAPMRPGPDGVDVRVEADEHGAVVTVVAPDRVGLLADVAAVLAWQRVPVRAARIWLEDDLGVSRWDVDDPTLDASVLRQRFLAIASGRLDPRTRLRIPPPTTLEPTVVIRPDASAEATVVEVRCEDRPGVVHAVCRALADLGLSVRSAHVDTLGPQAVDVFYVQEYAASALSDERAASAAHAVRAALMADEGDD